MSHTIKVNELHDKPLILCGDPDSEESIMQGVAILLSTKQGSVPFYRDFGLPMEYVGKPVNLAPTLMTMEIAEALQKYERRVLVRGINSEIDIQDPAKLMPVVEVIIDAEKS